MREMARLPRAEEAQRSEAPRVGWRHILAVLGVLLLVAGVALGVYRAGRPLERPVLADYPPAMVWMAWQELRLGVDGALGADQLAYHQAQRNYQRFGYLAAGLVAAGLGTLLVAGAQILVHRRRST